MTQRLSSDVLALVAERFRVLSEPTRLGILNVLLEGERSVTDLVDETGLNQANVSKHLGILRASGYVDRRKEGLYAYYSVADSSVAELCDIMCRKLEAEAEEQAEMLATGT
ncbi:MAG: metalloregulator ArsR/SmtB family transcription factor [Gemmatimonadota bacterium]|nr:metalloregulator ArsR/SmtB family transcription factor [Gemmatimonadota bacterium]